MKYKGKTESSKKFLEGEKRMKRRMVRIVPWV